ncbi:MAG: hypothetical protein BWY59_01934 [Verrucomicrobia bacterium ADurb.Bin345]|nr:MAG: hypothetical protein BWY59_01934 [Verrucomicrobia bacterium ADurb.Bin345]
MFVSTLRGAPAASRRIRLYSPRPRRKPSSNPPPDRSADTLATVPLKSMPPFSFGWLVFVVNTNAISSPSTSYNPYNTHESRATHAFSLVDESEITVRTSNPERATSTATVLSSAEKTNHASRLFQFSVSAVMKPAVCQSPSGLTRSTPPVSSITGAQMPFISHALLRMPSSKSSARYTPSNGVNRKSLTTTSSCCVSSGALVIRR